MDVAVVVVVVVSMLSSLSSCGNWRPSAVGRTDGSTSRAASPYNMQHMPVSLSRNDQRSYSTLGPASAWMGDRLWMCKPPQRRTRHLGLLNLIYPFMSRLIEYPAKTRVVNRHIAYRCPWSCSVGWCLAEGLV